MYIKMGYIQNTAQQSTINLDTYLEGFGNIDFIEFINLTTRASNWWDPISGWTGVSQAEEADNISIYVEVGNEGDTTDTLFAEFVSADVTPAEALIQVIPNVPSGYGDSAEWIFTMPPNNVNITINAGHEE